MRKQEQAAIEALAEHFSATWEKGEAPPDAYITMAGKRIAVDVASIKRRIAGRDGLGKPRLRFDRVALRFITGLQAALHEDVPDGDTVIVTVTAPIRLPAKAAAALEDKIRSSLARRSGRVELTESIHGNQIRVRLVRGGPSGASRVIGFVHNPDSDPDVLLDMTQSLLERIGAMARRRSPARVAGDRWLVILDEGGISDTDTCRLVYAQLSLPTDFKKILMVLAGGRVETLAG